MCQISPASVCSFKEYLPPLNISNSCQPAAAFFFSLLYPCTRGLVILNIIVYLWFSNEGQAGVNRAASYWGVALHVAEVQIAASTKGPWSELKWIPLFISACVNRVLEDHTYGTVAQHSSACRGCQNTHRTFVSKYALSGALLSVTYMALFVISVPCRLLLMPSGNHQEHPGEREGGEGGGGGFPLLPHLFPPAASARIERQSTGKQSVAFRRTCAAKFLISLSCFLSPNRTNVPFAPALNCTGSKWVMALLVECKLYLLLKHSTAWYNWNFSSIGCICDKNADKSV